MKKRFKKHFIPHEGNDFKPHFLREASVAVVTLIIIATFLASLFHASLLVSRTDFIAAVLPGVLVDLTNEERGENGLGGLAMNPTLTEAARLKAEDMARKGYFAHNSPDGLTPWVFFFQAGYQFTHAGENLAVNFSDSGDVVSAWMESPGHRANILNGNFTEIGIAAAEGEYKGEETIFVVQLFARPASSAGSVSGASIEDVEDEADDGADEDTSAPIQLTTEGPIQDEESDVAPIETETIEVTDIVESNDSLYIAVRDNRFSEDEGGEEEGGDEGSDVSADVDVDAEDGTESASTSEQAGEDPESEEDEVGTTSPVVVGSTEAPVRQYSSMFERLFASPNNLLKSIYMGIGALIVLALLLQIAIEVEKQHKMGIAYGVMMLLIIAGLTFLNQAILFSDTVIASGVM